MSPCLKEQFPRVFQLSMDKDISPDAKVNSSGGQNNWNFRFRRSLHAWEEVELNRLQLSLGNGPNLRVGYRDNLVWKPDQFGHFKVSYQYNWLQFTNSPVSEAHDMIWNNLSPPKAQFFAWLACRGRIKTSEYLQRIGALNGNVDPTCVFCKNDKESLQHVLLPCPFVWCVWSNLLEWWGLQWALPGTIDSLFMWWMGWRYKREEKQLWKALPIVVLWSVWKHRNECVFNGAQPDADAPCYLIKVRVALRMKSHLIGSSYTVTEFTENLQQVRRCLGH